jgi:hypothetical protein
MKRRLVRSFTIPESSSFLLSPKKIPADLKWSREVRLAVGNGMSKVTGPGDQFLEEVLNTLEEWEAGFKGL